MERLKHFASFGLIYSMMTTGLALSLEGTEQRADKGNWASLHTLVPGEKVMVVLDKAQAFRGQFKTFSDEAIELHLVTGDRIFQRANVLRVSAKGQSHRGRNALIGALVGAGTGLGLGMAADKSSKCGPSGPFLCGGSFNYGKEILTPAGAIGGGLVGAVLPSGGWREIYRAR
jgi:hypothetical protein